MRQFLSDDVFIAAETSYDQLLNGGLFFICPTILFESIQELNVNIHFAIYLRLNEDKVLH